MNWKVLVAVACGVVAGIVAAPRMDRTAQASTIGTQRYQIQGVVTEEPNLSGLLVSSHEVFLLDSDTGRVWQYSAGVTTKQSDGTQQYFPAQFQPVSILPHDFLKGSK